MLHLTIRYLKKIKHFSVKYKSAFSSAASSHTIQVYELHRCKIHRIPTHHLFFPSTLLQTVGSPSTAKSTR